MFSDFYPETTLENLNATLDMQGVAVLPNVFSEHECNIVKKSVLAHLANGYSVKQPGDFQKLKVQAGGIFHKYGVALIKEVLDLKTNERTIAPFAHIWREEELTTSLDGIYLAPPPEQTASPLFFDAQHASFHTDQASNKKEKCCIQAFINMEHTENGDGCLSVLVNSHRFHQEFFKHFNVDSKGKDWFLLNKTDHLEWFKQKGCEWKMIMAPRGSMVFWDSRTIHMGTLPREGRLNADRWRFVIYVCYTPARMQSEEDVELKKQAYLENRCTAHWPYGVRLFGKSDAASSKTNDLSNLTERHRKYLFGCDFNHSII